MPLRDSGRLWAEHVLRALGIGALAWMLWLSLDDDAGALPESARLATMTDMLPRWTTGSIAPTRITLQLDSLPTPLERDWLRALSAAGTVIRWSGPVTATAIAVQPVVSPNGGLRVVVAAPESAVVMLSDELGAIDSVRTTGAGAFFRIAAATGAIGARTGGTGSSATLRDSVTIRRVLVIGAAGWESKFVVAALEEDGWSVDADIRVAPGIGVTQGAITSIDTARYAAVIALDAFASGRAAQINRYVTTGGGLILAGRGAAGDAFASMRAGESATASNGLNLTVNAEATTRGTLALVPVVALRPDAVPIERRNGAVAAAARRHGAGRVLQHGYLDSWRWRMSGGENSVAEHRRWWTDAVASVAYAPRTSLAGSEATNPAPLAALVAALGPPSGTDDTRDGESSLGISPWWLFALLSISIAIELASRRLRGAR